MVGVLDVQALIGNLFLMVVPAVGAIIVGLRSHGRTRTFGIVGLLLSAVAGLGWMSWQFLAMGLDGGDGAEVALRVVSVSLTLCQCVGLVLLIMAVVVAEPAAVPAPGNPYGHPGPSTYQGPWSQA